MRDSLNQNSNSIQSAIKRKIDIALLGPKEIFGEEEIIFNLKKRNYTITCSSLIGEVLVITKDVFFKLLKSNYINFNLFQDNYIIYYKYPIIL